MKRVNLGQLILRAIYLLIIIGIFSYLYPHFHKIPQASLAENREFSPEALARYNGENPSLPIYLGLDGKVYDVTSGKQYYMPGASYHYLAGRDASIDLHAVLVAGLVKMKYPVVGTLKNR